MGLASLSDLDAVRDLETPESRRRRSLFLAQRVRLRASSAEAFADRMEFFFLAQQVEDAEAAERLRVALEDSPSGMLRRVNEVIADLVEQLDLGAPT